jgi:hypothetical protein
MTGRDPAAPETTAAGDVFVSAELGPNGRRHALAVVRRSPGADPRLTLSDLRRYPASDFEGLADGVRQALASPEAVDRARLVIRPGGANDTPVARLLASHRTVPPVVLHVTGGDRNAFRVACRYQFQGLAWWVSLASLAHATREALDSGRLSAGEWAGALAAAVGAFDKRPPRPVSFVYQGAVEGPEDDMLIAVGSALWTAARPECAGPAVPLVLPPPILRCELCDAACPNDPAALRIERGDRKWDGLGEIRVCRACAARVGDSAIASRRRRAV